MIKYIKGDLFRHDFVKGVKYYVPHVVNNIGIMGSGFAAGVNKHWPSVNFSYIELYDKHGLDLGQTQFLNVEPNVVCANMIAQRKPGGYSIGDKYFRPIVLEALEECMYRVKYEIDKLSLVMDCEIVAPKFGSMRAGGNWEKEITPMIHKIWSKIPVTIYEYEEKSEHIYFG